MRVLFAGTPEVALPALVALLASSHEVVGVLTRPDAPAGRGRGVVRSPVGLAADAAGIPVFTPRTLRDPQVQAELLGLGVMAAAVVAYGNLIPRPLLDAFPWVNLHFSLLPAWRGAAPVQWAIAHGDRETGACCFLLEEGMDTGPVLGCIRREIGPRETAGMVLADLAELGAPLLVTSLDSLAAGTARPQPQSAPGVSLAPKISVAQAQVDWRQSATAIDRQIRAFTPHPGAWSELDSGGRIKIGPVLPLGGVGEASVGAVAVGEVVASKNAVIVGTGDGVVQLGEVAPAGKSWMDAAAWARGLRGNVTFRSGQ